MFDRLISLVGEDNINKLNSKHVLIVGLGGVGGHAFEALVRSNIGEITIIDNDIINLSNLNRQIITNQNNIGNLKVNEAKKRALNINPNIKVNDLNIFLDESNINDVFKIKYDYVIDACDTVKTKIALIDICIKKEIKIISSMGTAKKLDPSKLKITELKYTSYDPLAKLIRKHFKDKKVIVVSSDEEVDNNTVLGSNAFVPATAGLLCASYVINDIIS